MPSLPSTRERERERKREQAEEGGLQQEADTPLSPLSLPHFQKDSFRLFLPAATNPSAKQRAKLVPS